MISSGTGFSLVFHNGSQIQRLKPVPQKRFAQRIIPDTRGMLLANPKSENHAAPTTWIRVSTSRILYDT